MLCMLLSIAYRLGVSAKEIDSVLTSLRITGRRQEVRRAACGARVIDDTYNAAPESMAAALDLLCSLLREALAHCHLGDGRA